MKDGVMHAIAALAAFSLQMAILAADFAPAPIVFDTPAVNEKGIMVLGNGGVVFAPAQRYARHGNVETPELYCVFPFRLCSFEKPNAETGRRTYTDGRFHRLYFGWAQDELNAAYLGMAEEAREHIVDRVFKNTPTLGRTIGCNEENIAERTYRPSEYRTTTGVPIRTRAACSRTRSSPCYCSTRATGYSSCQHGRRSGTATSGSTRRGTRRWRAA